MNADIRRQKILESLQSTDTPLSATALAKKYEVSRQIVVGDIALLRALGSNITATSKGYILESLDKTDGLSGITKKIVSMHTGEQTERELQICVDNGCSVIDVIVEHPVYGQLTGVLNICSRYDVSQFMEKVAAAEAHALSELTDGIHIHTLRCPNEAAYKRVCDALIKEKILLVEE